MKKSLSMVLMVIVTLGMVFPVVAGGNKVYDKIVIDGLCVEVYEKRTEEKKSKVGDTIIFFKKEWHVLSEVYDLPIEARDFSEEEKLTLASGGRIQISYILTKDPFLGLVNTKIKDTYLDKNGQKEYNYGLFATFVLLFWYYASSFSFLFSSKNYKARDFTILSGIFGVLIILVILFLNKNFGYIDLIQNTIFGFSVLGASMLVNTVVTFLVFAVASLLGKYPLKYFLVFFCILSLATLGIFSFISKIPEFFIIIFIAQIFGLLIGMLIKRLRNNKIKELAEEDFALT